MANSCCRNLFTYLQIWRISFLFWNLLVSHFSPITSMVELQTAETRRDKHCKIVCTFADYIISSLITCPQNLLIWDTGVRRASSSSSSSYLQPYPTTMPVIEISLRHKHESIPSSINKPFLLRKFAPHSKNDDITCRALSFWY